MAQWKPLPVPWSRSIRYTFIAAVDIGTAYTKLAWVLEKQPKDVNVYDQWILAQGKWQVPTAVLYKPTNKEKTDWVFDSFGQEAITQHEQQEEEGWLLFRRFKMELHKQEDFGTAITVKSSYFQDGKSIEVTFKALRVFTDSLKYIVARMLERLSKAHGHNFSKRDIKWVLTVPAMWKASARDFMRQAARQAEIYEVFEPRQLALALEPESAALHIRSLQKDDLLMGTAVDAKQYIVIDVGGGTIDIAVHKVHWHRDTGKEYVHEIKGCIGSDFGATLIDKHFEDFLCALNVPDYPNFFLEMKENPQTWNKLLDNFEVSKANFDGSTSMRVELPSYMLACYQEKATRQLSTALTKDSSPGAYVQKGSAYLRVVRSTCLDWYRPTIDSVVKLVRSLDNEYRVQALFVVGGFAECPILRKELEVKFPDLQLVIPDIPGLAVIKGAVRYGPERRAIASRHSHATYGVSSATVFQDGLHDKSKKFWSKKYNTYYCHDIFSVFVRKGEEVNPSTPYKHTYEPMELDQTEMTYWIYATDSQSPKYVTDRGCVRIGQITLPIERLPPGARTAADDNRSADFSMDFSGSEIFFTSVDNTRKHHVEKTVDYLPAPDY